MLSNKLWKIVVLRHRMKIQRFPLQRCLSSQKETEASPNNGSSTMNMQYAGGFPTRHSRHHTPSIAPPDILADASNTIIQSNPGTLFAYNPDYLYQSKLDEFEHGLKESNHFQQKVEYILRGYSTLLPSSIVNCTHDTTPPTNLSGISSSDEIVNQMINLLERVELEGRTYVELRSKYHSQLARVSSETTDPDSAKSENSETIEDASSEKDSMKLYIDSYGAPPGRSTTMYDLILDAIAVTIPSSPNKLTLLKTSRELYLRVLNNNELNKKAGTVEANPSSIPSACTFNAVIRASCIETTDERSRDTAFENMFLAFNTMYHDDYVYRNSATYRYMLQALKHHFPISELRGNIACGMWQKCITDKVLDMHVYEALKKLSDEGNHSLDYDRWWAKIEGQFTGKDTNGYGFPIDWGKNKRVRRYHKRINLY